MTVDERFRDTYASLQRLKDELLAAREAARDDAAEWGGWSVRYNQRLRFERGAMGILLRPPEEADARLVALYEAGAALRLLWEAMNRLVQGQRADVAGRRVALEGALARAHEAVMQP